MNTDNSTTEDLSDFVREALGVCTVTSVHIHPEVDRIEASDAIFERYIPGPARIMVSIEMVVNNSADPQAQELFNDAFDMAEREIQEINNSERRW